MGIGVAGKIIAVFVQPVHHFLCLPALFRHIILSLIPFVGTVSQNSGKAGQCQRDLVSVVGKVRMLLHKGLNDRKNLSVGQGRTAVGVVVASHDGAVFDHQAIHHARTLLAGIVGYIVYGNDQRLFALVHRNRIGQSCLSVCVHHIHIVDIDETVSVFIQRFQQPPEFGHRQAIGVQRCAGIGAALLRVVDQAVGKHMLHQFGRHLFRFKRHNRGGRIFRSCRIDGRCRLFRR